MKVYGNDEFNLAKAMLELASPLIQQIVNESQVKDHPWELQKNLTLSRLHDLFNHMHCMHIAPIYSYEFWIDPINIGNNGMKIIMTAKPTAAILTHHCSIECWHDSGFHLRFLMWEIKTL